MDCISVQILLPEYAGAELAPEAAASVARHLEACAACRAEMQSYGAAYQALAAP